MGINEITKIFKSLDSKDKFRILNLILKEGKKSVTDVKNQLDLSFSTAHKYLTKLEEAGLLRSEGLTIGGRKKKLFSIKPFRIELGPETISKLIEGEERAIKGEEIKVIDWDGKLASLDLAFIRKICIEGGVPLKLVDSLMERIIPQLYEGISLAEVKESIERCIHSEEKAVKLLKENLEKSGILARKRNFLDFLRERSLHSIVESHLRANLHIRNLGEIYPTAVQHNFALILKYGLKIIGISANPAKYIDSAISHLETTIGAVQRNMADSKQSFDFLNILLAPFVRGLNPRAIRQRVERIIFTLNQLHLITGVEPTINLELCIPNFLRKFPAWVGGKQRGVLGDYESESIELLKAFLDLAPQDYPKLVVKVRSRKDLPEGIEKFLDRIYIANLTPKWQGENANYMRDWCRLGCEWKGWERSFGTCEIQMITLNLPRLGYGGKEKELFEILLGKIEEIKSCFLASIERMNLNFYTKLKFLSQKVGRDKYCHLDDGICLIGVIGLSDLIEILGGDLREDPKFGLRILRFIEKKSRGAPFRIALIENDFFPVIRRFLRHDNLFFKARRKAYLGGVDVELGDEEKIELVEQFHPLLRGGHMCKLKRLDIDLLDKVLRSKVGLVCSSKALLRP